MTAAGQDHDVVVRLVDDQRTKIEGHSCFPVTWPNNRAVDAPWIDHQTTGPTFPHVLQELEHCATGPAVLPAKGTVPEQRAREELIDADGAGDEICQLTIQEIESFQCQQDSRPVLGKLVRDLAYQFGDFVGAVDFAKHDHSVLPQERDVVDGHSHVASARVSGGRTIRSRSHLQLSYQTHWWSGRK